eukprot:307986_1
MRQQQQKHWQMQRQRAITINNQHQMYNNRDIQNQIQWNNNNQIQYNQDQNYQIHYNNQQIQNNNHRNHEHFRPPSPNMQLHELQQHEEIKEKSLPPSPNMQELQQPLPPPPAQPLERESVTKMPLPLSPDSKSSNNNIKPPHPLFQQQQIIISYMNKMGISSSSIDSSLKSISLNAPIPA